MEMLTMGSLGSRRDGAVVWATAAEANVRISRKTSLFRTKSLNIFRPEFIDSLSGVLLPKLRRIAALPHGGIQLHGDLVVLIGGEPFEERAGDAIAVGIFGAIGARARALAGRLVLKPADIVGQPFDEPAGVAAAAILL